MKIIEFMKTKILVPSVIFGALAAFLSFRYINTYAQDDNQNAIIQSTVMALIQEGHYAPSDINDAFSKKVFEKALESLDYDKRFFLKEDIDALKKHEKDIDDQIKENRTDFFNDLNAIFVKRVQEVQSYYAPILKVPFNFNQNDDIQLDGKKLDYVKNNTELKDRWEKALKYRTLMKFVDLQKSDAQKVKDSVGYKAQSDVALEQEARTSVEKMQVRFFKRLNKMNENDRFSIYMNAITSAEDPHTNYFPPEDRKRFDEMMSGEFIGIGAQLQSTDEGFTKVVMIITGSPSWQQGQLKANDIIEKVQSDSTKEPVDIEGYEIDEVVKLIRGKINTTVKLHVKHPDGTRQIIAIKRGKVNTEDTYAKSSIVEENGKRIGYIYLPEFYTNFNGNGSRTSSEDVKKEVISLKEENVDAIVLDLRNNGGGSLGDVVDMAGIFIGTGPVVQVRARSNYVTTLSSRESEPIYSGPLAIMVNGGSASASEILAAAMQDYGRAVIIGANTFGKGTVQKLVGLDPFVSPQQRKAIIQAWESAKKGDAVFEGIGSLKLTIQKFYRISGGSTQLKGVTPDILLPDAYAYLDEYGERKTQSALPWDKIKAAQYTEINNIPNLKKFVTDSKSRVDANETFKLAKQTALRLKDQQANNIFPLSLVKFKAKLEESEAITKKLDEIDSAKTKLVVINLKKDLKRVNLDTASIEKNKKWLTALKKDAYLNETVNVLNEWVKLVALAPKRK
ncbi:MAG TPA: carboxy terminal-processing peptidase [Edaphocola sp.]|nr:carboxy terminal-processing peptidase [Edaphocola sp.]